ncbi:nitroreductase family protein [Paenibacillus sp. KQZ6P-2]|uniref:Nitroreductase family protein n=1 Tax=Paenibacillus mangrovi TaxID=2931978 RepID=A0A9X2B4L5_9BACL|nr:nitroreductase family protein [Paenibacillus mangrovi]MCJ8014759.1 nitroreductase family protein [Paenibacillus mangrovi]
MNTALTTNDFNQIVTGRRSIRKYDPNVKISRDEMTEILRKATLAPSSVNMQPWRFLIIESPKAKAILAPLARFNQSQVETSSAVIAIFGDLNSINNAEEIYGKAVELGFMPNEVKEMQLAAISAHYAQLTPELNRETVLIDSGLVSMQLMLVARAHGYDTNPIGGYEKDKVTEAFGLDPERYVPVMLISIGKAADSGYPSVRLPIDQVATWK